ncbi:hypothetical protein [Brevundimonas sp.]|uniref:hypothetical protein n=1 Tax=Brevundimonas sp. TaxID=1871086 RepID=UPI00289FD1EB|nr:hypothetical protein [Brevundimonas sp.]
MTDDPCPHPRPAFDAWLRLHRKNYAWAAEKTGRSREFIRRCCLPFSDPLRAKPGGDLVERIIRVTGGAVRADDWHPPVSEILRGEAA